MRVLVTVGSKHGNTRKIGEAIADTLGQAGLDAELREPAAADPRSYDAVIVGSGVYIGKWTPEAREFIELHVDALRDRPIWLFSSGPLGDPPKPADDPVDVAALTELLPVRGHRLFSGNLDRARLGFGERAVTRMVRAPYGDFRDWSEIRAWAQEIARELLALPALTR